MADVVAIVPTFNEIESLSSIVGRIRAAAPHAHVLIVDDSSPDGTGRLADLLSASDDAVSVRHRTE